MGLGVRVYGFRVEGLGFRVWNSINRVSWCGTCGAQDGFDAVDPGVRIGGC